MVMVSVGEGLPEVLGWLEAAEDHGGGGVPDHACFGDDDFGGFLGGEEDVVVGGVSRGGEFLRGEISAEVVAAAGSDVERAENFLVLDIAAGGREELGSEAQFTEHTGHGVVAEFAVVFGDGVGVAMEENGALDATAGDFHEADRGVGVAVGEGSIGSGGDEVDFPGGEVGDVGFRASAESVAFLGLLSVGEDAQGTGLWQTLDGEVDFEGLGAGQGETQLFGLAADLVVVHGQAGAEDDVVEAMEGGTAEPELFGVGGEWGGGGEGGDAEEDIEARVDVGGEGQTLAGGGIAVVGEVEVAAAGDGVGEQIAADQTELLEHALTQALVEDVVGVALDLEGWVGEEGEIAYVLRVGEIDEEADALAGGGGEDGGEQSGEVEWREGWVRLHGSW